MILIKKWTNDGRHPDSNYTCYWKDKIFTSEARSGPTAKYIYSFLQDHDHASWIVWCWILFDKIWIDNERSRSLKLNRLDFTQLKNQINSSKTSWSLRLRKNHLNQQMLVHNCNVRDKDWTTPNIIIIASASCLGCLTYSVSVSVVCSEASLTCPHLF